MASRKPRWPGASTILRFEELEDRINLDVFRWFSPFGVGSWSNRANWQMQAAGGGWGLASRAPGENDTLIFDGASDLHSIADVPAVAAIEVLGAYDGTILLTGTLQVWQSFDMRGSRILPGQGFDPGEHMLYVSGNYLGSSVFAWSGGSIEVDLRIGATGAEGTTQVEGTISGNVTLKAAYLSIISGHIRWTSGSITTDGGMVNGTLRKVLVSVGGALDIESSHGMGKINQQTNLPDSTDAVLLSASTNGAIRLRSNAVIGGSILNEGKLTADEGSSTTVNYSVLQVGTGVTKLKYGTIKGVNPSNVSVPSNIFGYNYGVHPAGLTALGGSLTGIGAIHGGVTLGKPDQQSEPDPFVATPTIRPGIEWDALTFETGEINIVGPFVMAPYAVMRISLVEGGSISQVSTSGSATLAGTLNMSISDRYWPGVGTTKTFLTAGGGIQGDFAMRVSNWWGSWPDPGTSGKNLLWNLSKTASTYSLVAEIIPGSGPPDDGGGGSGGGGGGSGPPGGGGGGSGG